MRSLAGGFRVRPGGWLAAGALTLAVAAGLAGCGSSEDPRAREKRVIVLGLDGLDYDLTRQLMEEGRMPNFVRLAESGGFSRLGTAIPPQSPVAWSNFITGMDSGGHGIFDFLHRDPETMVSYLSTSRAVGAASSLQIGDYQLPLEAGTVELLRRGEAFWEVLERHGIEANILRIPANFPPSGLATRELSGMGTPDSLGPSGMFSVYTSDPSAVEGRDMPGEFDHLTAEDREAIVQILVETKPEFAALSGSAP